MKKQQRSIKQVSPTLLISFQYKDEQGRKTIVQANPPIPIPFLDSDDYKKSIKNESKFRNDKENDFFIKNSDNF